VCKRSIRHYGSTNATSRWMTKAVLLKKDGAVVHGVYDGYGRVDGKDVGESPRLYHEACWEQAGKPAYGKPSKRAADQGHFVGDDPAEPKGGAA
jgi:hypothetical protein